jgi:hypothetical protein
MKTRTICLSAAVVIASFLSCQQPVAGQVHGASPASAYPRAGSAGRYATPAMHAPMPAMQAPAHGPMPAAAVGPAMYGQPVEYMEGGWMEGGPPVEGCPPGYACPPGDACPPGYGYGYGNPHFGQPSRVWGQAEYLLLWSDKRYVPALVTTSPQATPAEVAGRLGLSSTSVLLGDEGVGNDAQSGFRVGLGFWLNRVQTVGIGARYFLVGGDDDQFRRSSAGDPILARPFFNAALGEQDALLVAYPGLSTGSVDMTTSNQAQGADIFLRLLLHSGYGNRFDLIGGYQFSRIDDSVIATDTLSPLGPDIPSGSFIETTDLFKTQNDFHGGYVGLMGLAEDGRITWRMLGKVAFGNMNQQATVSGRTLSSVPGTPDVTRDFGLLALPTNIGTYEQDKFAVVPELDVSVAYKLTNQLEVSIGYALIYWNEVLTAGDLIDLDLNPTQIDGDLVGPAVPSVTLDSHDLWYQGLTAGVAWRF